VVKNQEYDRDGVDAGRADPGVHLGATLRRGRAVGYWGWRGRGAREEVLFSGKRNSQVYTVLAPVATQSIRVSEPHSA
jgi:hypothetical protein